MFAAAKALRVTVLCMVLSVGFAQAQEPQGVPSARQTGQGANGTVEPGRPNQPTVNTGFALSAAHAISDNIGDTTPAVRGSYDSAGIQFSTDRMSRRVDLAMVTDLEFRNYSETFVPDEHLGNLDLLANLHIVPERFSWSFQDDFDQRRINALDPLNPLNREDFNVVSTGPQVTLPFSRRMYIGLGGLYSDRRYETTEELDSQYINREFGLFRRNSATSVIGIVAQSSDIEYDDLNLPKFTVESALLRYLRTLAGGSLGAELGTSKLKVANLDVSGPLVRLDWTRPVATRSRITLSLNRQFTDSGSLLRLGIGRTSGELLPDILLSPNPMKLESARAHYTLTLDRSFFFVGFNHLDEDYKTADTLDNRGTDMQMGYRRILNPRLDVAVDLGSLRRRFLTTDVTTRDELAGVQLSRTLGSKLAVALRLEVVQRTGQADRSLYELRLYWRPHGNVRAGNIGLPGPADSFALPRT
jgi:hypothetical protein